MNWNWRDFLSRLSLPMLALAASYGVYQFASLFVPDWVAITQAAAFELTYIGLAVATGLDNNRQKRARAVSIGAVVVSILYNALAGFFQREPALLHTLPWFGNVLLAALHGAPLAWVAYLVSDLLLHTSGKQEEQTTNQQDALTILVTELANHRAYIDNRLQEITKPQAGQVDVIALVKQLGEALATRIDNQLAGLDKANRLPAPDLSKHTLTIKELARKVQRRQIGIADFDNEIDNILSKG